MRKLLLFMLAVTTPVIAFGETQFKGTVKDSSGTPISGAMVLIQLGLSRKHGGSFRQCRDQGGPHHPHQGGRHV
jgi:hypothetical protein